MLNLTGFRFILFFSLALILIKLFSLQVISGSKFAQEAEQNRIKILPLSAPRGIIFDRKGEILARNIPLGREYPAQEIAAHIVGYVGEANEDELENFAVSLGSLVGKMGVEREEDKLLRGTDGGIIVETDSQGTVIREMSRKDPIPGQDLTLFLDKKLQEIASRTLGEQPGAVVVMTPGGEVLVLVSSPSFDPNLFSQKQEADQEQLREEKMMAVLNDELKPMFDRAIAGLYPPASIFKIITAVAGLETGLITANQEIEDTGEIKIGNFRYGNWYFDQYGKKEGMMDIWKAIRRSNDIYFYRVGERLGITKLAAWAKAFGLGKATGIPLKGEADGLVPDEEWKKKVRKESWYLGDTYITAIGQGDLQTTPIQMAQVTAVVAASGKLCTPRIVDDGQGDKCQSLPIEQKSLTIVKEGMKQACETGGTGWPLFNFRLKNERIKIDGVDFIREASDAADVVRIPVACKTGTAEFGDPEGKTHAWFSVFAPVENPEIVVTVLLEKAGQGSDKAAPVAKAILQAWFEGK